MAEERGLATNVTGSQTSSLTSDDVRSFGGTCWADAHPGSYDPSRPISSTSGPCDTVVFAHPESCSVEDTVHLRWWWILQIVVLS